MHSLLQRQQALSMTVFSLLVLLVLAACGGGTNTTTTASSATSAGQSAQSTSGKTTEAALISKIKLMNSPTVKITGTTFMVTGQIKNGDTKQHDIFVQATLLDASGKAIATSTLLNIDNVAPAATVPYTIQGTTSQPDWSKVQVSVIKVSENVNGAGAD